MPVWVKKKENADANRQANTPDNQIENGFTESYAHKKAGEIVLSKSNVQKKFNELSALYIEAKTRNNAATTKKGNTETQKDMDFVAKQLIGQIEYLSNKETGVGATEKIQLLLDIPRDVALNKEVLPSIIRAYSEQKDCLLRKAQNAQTASAYADAYQIRYPLGASYLGFLKEDVKFDPGKSVILNDAVESGKIKEDLDPKNIPGNIFQCAVDYYEFQIRAADELYSQQKVRHPPNQAILELLSSISSDARDSIAKVRELVSKGITPETKLGAVKGLIKFKKENLEPAMQKIGQENQWDELYSAQGDNSFGKMLVFANRHAQTGALWSAFALSCMDPLAGQMAFGLMGSKSVAEGISSWNGQQILFGLAMMAGMSKNPYVSGVALSYMNADILSTSARQVLNGVNTAFTPSDIESLSNNAVLLAGFYKSKSKGNDERLANTGEKTLKINEIKYVKTEKGMEGAGVVREGKSEESPAPERYGDYLDPDMLKKELQKKTLGKRRVKQIDDAFGLINSCRNKLNDELGLLREKPEENRGKIKAIVEIQRLNKLEMDDYLGRVQKLKADGKADPKRITGELERLADMQEDRSSSENMEWVAKTLDAPKTIPLKAALSLLPPGTDIDELEATENKMGITYEVVMDPNCEDFLKAYKLLNGHFPLDEVDPQSDLAKMLRDNKLRYPKLCSEKFAEVGPDMKDPLYMRYYLLVAKNGKGEIIGVSDGNFIGTEKASSMYWAHIAVPSEERRSGVATLLYAATLGFGNEYSRTAENEFKALGKNVDYNTPIPGNKLMYYIVESEPVNPIDKESAKLTIGRLLFHGNGAGLSVIPALLYAQIDLESSPDSKFDPKHLEKWNTVPLLLLARRLGHENETEMPCEEAKQISWLMTSYFLSSGLYNSAGGKFDYEHSISMLNGENTPVIPLPSGGTELERLEQLEGMMGKIGTMEERCKYYKGYSWTNDYLKALERARKNGKAMDVDAALKYIMQEINRKKIIMPPGA